MNTIGRVKQGFYFDSVTLMRVGRELSGLPGVAEASVVMATEANKSILAMSDLLLPEFKKCGDQDLVIVVRAKDAKAANDALARSKSVFICSVGAAVVARARPNWAVDMRRVSYSARVARTCACSVRIVLMLADDTPSVSGFAPAAEIGASRSFPAAC